jgi:hypothetical protein
MLSLRDPLGTGRARPAPPADPDAYDAAREEVEGGRSFLSAADLAELKRDVAAHGLLDIAAVRSALALGRAGSDDGDDDDATVDPEMLLAVDVRVDFKVFLAGGEAYTRDDLYDHFAFHELGVTPEDVFAAQLVDAFAPRGRPASSFGGDAGYAGCDFVARDADDDAVAPGRVDDLVAMAGRRAGDKAAARQSCEPPLRTARTKVYVGRSRWGDFVALSRVCRGAVHVARRGGAVLALAGSAGGQFAALTAAPAGEPSAPAGAAPGGEPSAPAGASSAAGEPSTAELWAAIADLQRRVAELEMR